jgi:hypothetical protein
MSFVGSDSSGSGRERHRSKHREDCQTEIGIVVESRTINLVERILLLSFLPPGRRL